MPFVSKQHVLKFLLPAALLAVVTGGVVLAFAQPQGPLAATYNPLQSANLSPQPRSSPSPHDISTGPGSGPAVAGAATAAPEANSSTTSSASTGRSGGSSSGTHVSTQASSAPTPAQSATVVIIAGGNTQSFSVSPAGVNACTILSRVRDEGKITSVTITDKYVPTLQSLFVEEINGFRDNWTYKLGAQTAPWGCSNPRAPTIKAGDTITWTQG